MGPLAYPGNDRRQERVRRLAFSEADLRRFIREAAQGDLSTLKGVGMTIVLGDAFTVSAPIVIPSTAVGLRIEGRGIPSRLIPVGSALIDGVFRIEASYVEIDHVVAINVRATTTLFLDVRSVEALTVTRCRAWVDSFFVVPSGSVATNARFLACTHELAGAGGTSTWRGDGLYIDDWRGLGLEILESTGGFIGNASILSALTIGSLAGAYHLSGVAVGSGITTTAGSGGNRLASVIGSRTLHATDIDADAGGAPDTGSATLNSAGPTLTVGRATYIRVTFGAGSSGNVTLSDGTHHGQRLTLFCVSYAGSATLPDATAQNVKLSAAWTPTADDTLSLVWDATDGNWIETSRSTN
jgi:hypothetical protein